MKYCQISIIFYLFSLLFISCSNESSNNDSVDVKQEQNFPQKKTFDNTAFEFYVDESTKMDEEEGVLVYLQILNDSSTRIKLGKYFSYTEISADSYSDFNVPENATSAFLSESERDKLTVVVYGVYDTIFQYLRFYEVTYYINQFDFMAEHIFKVNQGKVQMISDNMIGDIIEIDEVKPSSFSFDEKWSFKIGDPHDGNRADEVCSFHANRFEGTLLLKNEEAYYDEMMPWVMLLPDGSMYAKLILEHGDIIYVKYTKPIRNHISYEKKMNRFKAKQRYFERHYTLQTKDASLKNECDLKAPATKTYTYRTHEDSLQNKELNDLIIATLDFDLSTLYHLKYADAMSDFYYFDFFDEANIPNNKMVLSYNPLNYTDDFYYYLYCITESNEKVTVERVEHVYPFSINEEIEMNLIEQ